MSALIAIMSHRMSDRQGTCRASWIDRYKPPHLFFVGGASDDHIDGDVLHLNCFDDYKHLPMKTHAMVRWVYANRPDVSHLFKCDDDTFVNVDRLMASGYESHDYSGAVHAEPFARRNYGVPYCSGGAGYWLSRRAMAVIAGYTGDIFDETRMSDGTDQGTAIEDGAIARVLNAAGITAHSDPRYCRNHRRDQRPDSITIHPVSGKLMRSLAL